MFRAEDLYTAVLADGARSVRPGARGTASFTLEGQTFTASWEVPERRVATRKGALPVSTVRAALHEALPAPGNVLAGVSPLLGLNVCLSHAS